MAENKETTKKKNTTPKKNTSNKKENAKKKVTKTVEENAQVINLSNATTEELLETFDKMSDDDVLAVEVNKEKVDVMNGDPAVLTPIEEKEESVTKKIIKKFNQTFGYLWNGQAIDF